MDALPPLTSASAEVALAWHTESGACRVLGVGLTREAARAAYHSREVPMVLERVGATSPTSGVVVDWKIGWQEELAPAAEHWQLLTYASVALLAYDWDEVTAALCRPDASPPRWDTVRLDWLAAEAHLARVKGLLAQVEEARTAYERDGTLPPLSLGPWCAWCPAQRRCPARVGAVLALVDGSSARALSPYVELTVEAAGEWYWRIKEHALPMLQQPVRDLESIARAQPLPLPDGTTLMEVEEGREEMDVGRAEEWLRLTYGDEVARATVRHVPEATWTSLQRALRDKVLPSRKAAHKASRAGRRGPTLTALEREARRGVRKAGAVKRVRWTAVRAVKPLPSAPPTLSAGGH